MYAHAWPWEETMGSRKKGYNNRRTFTWSTAKQWIIYVQEMRRLEFALAKVFSSGIYSVGGGIGDDDKRGWFLPFVINVVLCNVMNIYMSSCFITEEMALHFWSSFWWMFARWKSCHLWWKRWQLWWYISYLMLLISSVWTERVLWALIMGRPILLPRAWGLKYFSYICQFLLWASGDQFF